jgi:hypothetical protein
MGAVEMLLGSFDREPDPVHEEEREEDGYGEPEVPLQKPRTVDVWDHGEYHTDTREKP